MDIWDSIDDELTLLEIINEEYNKKDEDIYEWIEDYENKLDETTKT